MFHNDLDFLLKDESEWPEAPEMKDPHPAEIIASIKVVDVAIPQSHWALRLAAQVSSWPAKL